jgi:putative membrane protein
MLMFRGMNFPFNLLNQIFFILKNNSMKKNRFFLFVGVCLLAACGENNNKDDKDSVEKADSANEAKLDNAPAKIADQESVDFMMWAANTTMTEVAYAEAAKTKASRKEIKDIAATIEKDHKALHEQIKTLAQQKNITLPASLSDESRKDIDKLGEKTGNEYDKAFIKKLIDDHQDCIKRYERAANRTEDAEIQTFASQTLPGLRMHLDSAKAIEKKYW